MYLNYKIDLLLEKVVDLENYLQQMKKDVETKKEQLFRKTINH